jgi:hypothetical protein
MRAEELRLRRTPARWTWAEPPGQQTGLVRSLPMAGGLALLTDPCRDSCRASAVDLRRSCRYVATLAGLGRRSPCRRAAVPIAERRASDPHWDRRSRSFRRPAPGPPTGDAPAP